ncbi:MAG: MFS transporter [Firmicutes bacterium]|nr:MFS transporter [Bacillota bacterium]
MPGRWLLAYPNFWPMWVGQTLSLTGDAFTEVALAVWALERSHNSALAVGVVLLVAALPRVFLGWAVHLVVDRWHKQRLLWAVDLLRAGAVAVIPWLPNFAEMWGVVFVVQALGMLYLPALRAVVPETVDRDRLVDANALLTTSQAVSQIAGYALAGWVVLNWGAALAFRADAASYLLCGMLVWWVRLPQQVWRPAVAAHGQSGWESWREGMRYHRDHPIVLHLLGVSAMAGLALNGLTVLSAAAVPHLLHQSPGIYGFLLAAMAGGLSVGSLAFSRFHQRWRYGRWLAGGFWLGGGLCVVLGFTHDAAWAGLWYFGMGIANAAFLLPMRSWIAAMVPLEIRGRVYATRSVVLAATGAISAALGGWLAQALGVSAGLWIFGLTLGAAGCYSWGVPALRWMSGVSTSPG